MLILKRQIKKQEKKMINFFLYNLITMINRIWYKTICSILFFSFLRRILQRERKEKNVLFFRKKIYIVFCSALLFFDIFRF